MTATAKTVEQLLLFLAHKLSAPAQHVFAIYLRMVVIGAWERILVGAACMAMSVALGLLGADSEFDAELFWFFAILAFAAGGLLVVWGVGHLLDPQYQVLQLLMSQAGGN